MICISSVLALIATLWPVPWRCQSHCAIITWSSRLARARALFSSSRAREALITSSMTDWFHSKEAWSRCHGAQNIGLSNRKLKFALKCTVWSQLHARPKQTDKRTDGWTFMAIYLLALALVWQSGVVCSTVHVTFIGAGTDVEHRVVRSQSRDSWRHGQWSQIRHEINTNWLFPLLVGIIDA